MNLGASPQLEYWNDGIMGFEEMGQWIIDIFHLKMKELDEITALISIFQSSIIPLFQSAGQNLRPR
jgi:hypothetical protein